MRVFDQRGFTYIGVLFVVVLLGVALALAGQVWHTGAVRDREQDLLFAGDQFRSAIEAYYAANTGTGDRYPKSFEELLRDTHAPAVRRYLRRVYVDPMTADAQWGLIKTPAGGIMGVYSLAEGQPLKQANFPERYSGFAGATKYSGWQFIATVGEGPAPVAIAAAEPAAQPVPAQPVVQPPAQVQLPPPPKPGDKDRCRYIGSFDARVCAGEKAKWGSNGDCVASAQIRQSACEAGAALPPLNVRYL